MSAHGNDFIPLTLANAGVCCYHPRMKSRICLAIGIAVMVLLPSTALPQSAENRWGAAVRFNAGHGDRQDVPFDGDWSYGLVYEYREPQAYFQLVMSYAGKVSFTNEFDGKSGAIEAIWTPEFNIMFTQSSWAGGLGVLKHLVRREDGGVWSPVFWQFLVGLNLGQRSAIALDLMACYQFESWGEVKEINIRDVDIRISVTHAF